MGGKNPHQVRLDDITGQMSEEDNQMNPPDNIDGQLPEGDMQMAPPGNIDGELSEGDMQMLPSENADGEMKGQMRNKNMQRPNVENQSQQQSADNTSQVDNKDIIIVCVLVTILIAASVFLHRKHY